MSDLTKETFKMYTCEVHGGMLKLARAMALPGKPVHKVVEKALKENEGYGNSRMKLLVKVLPRDRPHSLWTQPRCRYCWFIRNGKTHMYTPSRGAHML